jgi:hypothetical protein
MDEGMNPTDNTIPDFAFAPGAFGPLPHTDKTRLVECFFCGWAFSFCSELTCTHQLLPRKI